VNATQVLRGAAWTCVGLLTAVVLVFVAIRLSQDVPTLVTGEMPPVDSFERRYADHPFLAYAHILPGVVYLLIAPFQVSRRHRQADLTRHRRLGRVALIAGFVTGAFAIAVGVLFPFGGVIEASASVVFGVYFLVALGLAFRAIRSGNERMHRRWMLRAFAIGLGVGTIRLVIGTSQALGVAFEDVFGVAFWIAFVLHAAAVELWLWRSPPALASRTLRSSAVVE
jgi:uncharacterized membrane protein YozB (DUF420 family)